MKFLISLVFIVVSASTQAGLVTYKFNGSTNGVLVTPPGSPFELSLTLDSSVRDPDASCGNPVHFGCFNNALLDFSLLYGGYNFVTSPLSSLSIAINNNFSGLDSFRFAAVVPDQLGFTNVEVTLDLMDFSQSAFLDTDFPHNLLLQNFDRAFMTLSVQEAGEIGNTASVSNISSIKKIPEPPVYMLIMLGLAGVIIVARKSRGMFGPV